MQLEYAKDPVWANADHTMIDLTIKWDHIPEELPFTACQNDCEAHGCAIFAAAAAGQYGQIGEYVPPQPDTEAMLEACKAQAKRLLEETDWSQLPDVAAQIGNKAAFDAYRAAVRAIYFNPVAEPVWPERPEADWL